MSPRTTRNLLGILQGIFSLAVDNDLIAKSPVRNRHKPTVRSIEKPIWSPVQLREILESTPEKYRQDAVLQPEAVRYAVDEFCRQLKEADGNLSREAEQAIEQKRKVQAELNRLVSAVADSGHSTSLIEAIDQREQASRNIDERLNACGIGRQPVQPEDVTDFVRNRLATLRDLLNSDVTQARAELLKHVSEIRLAPQQSETGSEYTAEGEWNLLGTYPEMDRARHLLGVRARLVAGACNAPNALVIPFRIELSCPAV
jgi:hypothetical protein